MRYLIFTNTPAHVHLYRHAVVELQERGHDVLVLGRDDSFTKELLEYYELPHRIYGKRGTTKASLARRLPEQFINIARMSRRYDPDVIFGRGAYSAFAKVAAGGHYVMLFDSIPWKLGYLLPSKVADTVVTTEAFRDTLGPNHYRFHGLKECAYLHPDVYTPDPSIREELGLDADERFVIVRLNGFGAFHDVGENGFSRTQARELIERLAEHATVLVSDESGRLDLSTLPARAYSAHPARIHDALYEAALLVADTGTMVTEAALLGTPAVRGTYHDDATDLGEMRELEAHALAENLPPERAIERAVELLEDETARETWRERRDAFLGERVNLTDLIVDIAEHPDDAATIVGTHNDESRHQRRPHRRATL